MPDLKRVLLFINFFKGCKVQWVLFIAGKRNSMNCLMIKIIERYTLEQFPIIFSALGMFGIEANAYLIDSLQMASAVHCIYGH
jgi:hypothetical protein